MAKKKPGKAGAGKRIKLKLPMPKVAACQPLTEEVIEVVPMPVVLEQVVNLPAATGPVPCIATLWHGWGSNYIVLAAKAGFELPPISPDGTAVDVTFCPCAEGK